MFNLYKCKLSKTQIAWLLPMDQRQPDQIIAMLLLYTGSLGCLVIHLHQRFAMDAELLL
jgi:hypothetical protein